MARTKLRKKFLIVITFFVSVQISYGQKTEISFNAYSGLFSFHGDGSSSTSWIKFNPYISPDKYTSNPYGKKSGVLMPLNCKDNELQKREIFTELELVLKN